MMQPKASVVGVTLISDVLEAAAFSACVHDKVRKKWKSEKKWMKKLQEMEK